MCMLQSQFVLEMGRWMWFFGSTSVFDFFKSVSASVWVFLINYRDIGVGFGF